VNLVADCPLDEVSVSLFVNVVNVVVVVVDVVASSRAAARMHKIETWVLRRRTDVLSRLGKRQIAQRQI